MGSSTEWPNLTYHQDGGKGRILFLGGEGGGSPYQAVTGKIYRL